MQIKNNSHRGRGTQTRGRGLTPHKSPRIERPHTVIEKQTQKSKGFKKGQVFTEEEIKTLLFGLYEGKDNGVIAADYLNQYQFTSRTKQALKIKIQSLRMECTSKFGNSAVEEEKIQHEKQLQECLDFLQPSFVIKNTTEEGKRFFQIHKKSNWEDVTVGYHGNKVRFQLFLKKDEKVDDFWNDTTIETKSHIYVTVEVTNGFKVKSKYEDTFFKGVELEEK